MCYVGSKLLLFPFVVRDSHTSIDKGTHYKDSRIPIKAWMIRPKEFLDPSSETHKYLPVISMEF